MNYSGTNRICVKQKQTRGTNHDIHQARMNYSGTGHNNHQALTNSSKTNHEARMNYN